MKKSKASYSSYGFNSDPVNDTSGLQNQISDLQEQAQYFQQQLSKISSASTSQAGLSLLIQELDKQVTDLSGYMFKQFNDLKKYLATLNQASAATPPPPQALQMLATSVSSQIQNLRDTVNGLQAGTSSPTITRTVSELQNTISEMNRNLSGLQNVQSTVTMLQNDIALLKAGMVSSDRSSGSIPNNALLQRI